MKKLFVILLTLACLDSRGDNARQADITSFSRWHQHCIGDWRFYTSHVPCSVFEINGKPDMASLDMARLKTNFLFQIISDREPRVIKTETGWRIEIPRK